MVCERQAEIDAFVPSEYWHLGADLKAAAPPPFTARLQPRRRQEGRGGERRGGGGDRPRPRGRAASWSPRWSARSRGRSPAPPFITSRLQQEAARRFGFAVKRTMALAQGLYEGREIGDRGSVGLITYMRTDSTRVADEAIVAVRETIGATYGDVALPEKPNVYKSKESAQDAHEAIRPTSFDLPPDAVRDFLKPDELEALQADLGPLHRLADAPCGLRRHPGRRRERRLHAPRLRPHPAASPGFLAVYRETPEEDAEPSADETGRRRCRRSSRARR